MDRKLTASVIGGGAGGRGSANALVASDRFELKAIADINAEVCQALKKEYEGIQTFQDHKRLFAECPTDIVCVSTWAPSHEEVVNDALDLPLTGILVEKPLGDTAAAGRRILDAIRARELPMAVPHGLLSLPSGRDVIGHVRSGSIGDLKLVEIQCDKWDILNAGIHWMHFFTHLTDMAPMDYVMAICEASTRTYRDGMQVETTAITYGQTKSGVRVVMNTGDNVTSNIADGNNAGGFRIVGSAGVIEYRFWADHYNLRNEINPKGRCFTPSKDKPIGHQWHLENMANNIDVNGPDYLMAESSLMALEICEAAYTSSRHRCKVTFPFPDFTPPAEPEWQPGMPYSGSGGGRDGRQL